MRSPVFLKLALFVAIIGCAFTLRAEPSKDGEASAKLIGIWMVTRDEYPDMLKFGTQTFRANGTTIMVGGIRAGDVSVRVEVEGKWRIEKGILIEEVTKSSHPQALPIGLITRDVILALNDEKCWLRSEEAGRTEHFLTRYNR